ncbi:uncharacterized protein LOC133799936 [Humulus lupulus]|uniref:uncharacterized protein LOC133799936 n=1 Tax=Humulus lupulus TaxID=3486 RepID=UPI002B405941|nr:uncharacterized protein LOC133799936 [Humulus lupulus]
MEIIFPVILGIILIEYGTNWPICFKITKPPTPCILKINSNNTFLRDFPNCTAYANRLKHIADQLANVGAKVTNDRLVLRLIGGLTESYATFVTVVQNMSPLPSFAKAKSMLLLDETNKKLLSSHDQGTDSALLVASNTNHGASSNISQNHDNHSQYSGNRGRRNNNNNRSRNNGNRNNGGGRGSRHQSHGGQAHNQNHQPPRSTPQLQFWAYPQWPTWGQPWATPPCPYPTTAWQPRMPSNKQQGVLGPRPSSAQSFLVASPVPSDAGYTPTTVEAAMHTLSLTPPDDNWYMDTGATSHMTANSGNLLSYFNLSKQHAIIVGNGLADGETPTEM